MPKFTIDHSTRYLYDRPAHNSANQIMLYPVKDMYQEVLDHQLEITGDPQIETFTDYYGNLVGTFTYAEMHSELLIASHVLVQV